MASPAEIEDARRAFMTDVNNSVRNNLRLVITAVNQRIDSTKRMVAEPLISQTLSIVNNEVPKLTSFTFIAKIVADGVKTKGRELQQEITDANSLRERQLASSKERVKEHGATVQRLMGEIDQKTRRIQALRTESDRLTALLATQPERTLAIQAQIARITNEITELSRTRALNVNERDGAERRRTRAELDIRRASEPEQRVFDPIVISLFAVLLGLHTEIILTWKKAVSEARTDDEADEKNAFYNTLVEQLLSAIPAFTGHLRELSSQFMIQQYITNLSRQFEAVKIRPILEIIKKTAGVNFGVSMPVDLHDLRVIIVCGKENTFLKNVGNKEGVLKFTEQEKSIRVRADNIKDLERFNTLTLEGMNAYAYFKLSLYAPQEAWTTLPWMKNLKNKTFEHEHWYENPVLRFDIFLNAWIVDTLSRVNALGSGKNIQELKAVWKQLVTSATGIVPKDKKINISANLLSEIKEFDAFFRINYEYIFPAFDSPDGRHEDRINPFHILINRDFAGAFAQQHFIEGIMIDCARSALQIYLRETATIKANNLDRYDGIPVVQGELIKSGKRVQIRGIKFFFDFLDAKFLSLSIDRTSEDLWGYQSVLNTFLKYVHAYVFLGGVVEGAREAWTANTASSLGNFVALRRYLYELKRRVETGKRIVDISPHIYMDVPIIEEIEDITGCPIVPLTPLTKVSVSTPVRTDQRAPPVEQEEEEEDEDEEEEESVSPPARKTPAPAPPAPPAPLPVRKAPPGERSVVGDPNAGSGSSSSGNPKVEQAFASAGRGPTLRGQATVTTPLLP
jgi:hypothetical protein